MRTVALGAFILDGGVAVAFAAAIAAGDRHFSPMSSLVLAALLAGFFCALAALVRPDVSAAKDEEAAALLITGAAMFDNLTDEVKDDVRQHFPERRRTDRRRAEAGVHAGPERRAGADRREARAAVVTTTQDVAAAVDREMAYSR